MSNQGYGKVPRKGKTTKEKVLDTTFGVVTWPVRKLFTGVMWLAFRKRKS